MALEQIIVNEPSRVAPATELSTPAQAKQIEEQASAAKIIAEQESSKLDTAALREGGSEAKLYGDIGIEAMGGGLLKLATSALEILDDRGGLSNPKVGDAQQSPGADLMERFNLWNGSLQMKSPKYLDGSGEFSDTKGLQVQGAANAMDMKFEGMGIARMLTLHNVMANKAALDSVKVYENKYEAAAAHVQRSAPTFGMGMSGPSINLATLQSGTETAVDEEMWQKNMRLAGQT